MPSMTRPVYRVRISDGKVDAYYKSIAEAARNSEDSASKIRSHCTDLGIGNGEFCWRYAEEYICQGPISRKSFFPITVFCDGYEKTYRSVREASRSEFISEHKLKKMASTGRSDNGIRAAWA